MIDTPQGEGCPATAYAVIPRAQFDAIATLMRSRGASLKIAELVMVRGWALKRVARESLHSSQAVWNTADRYRRAHALITEQFKSYSQDLTAGQTPRLTKGQFEVIAHFLRSRSAPKKAIEAVLLHGMPNAQAARDAGIRPQACWNAVQRAKRVVRLIQESFSIDMNNQE